MKNLPLCECGCGHRVLHYGRRWRQACVPKEFRAIGGRTARARWAFKMRTQRFRTEIDRVLGGRTRLSRAQLLELCDAIYRRGYMSGFSVSETRHRRGTAA